MDLILGSASKWRKAILQDAGFQFSVMHANIDEKAIRDPDPHQLVLTLAHAKAKALLPKVTLPSLLVTVDQIVVCHGEIFEKPESVDEVWHYVDYYRQYPAQTVTGIVVTNTQTGKWVQGVDVATVYFNEIPDSAVQAMIDDGEIFHCAGGFQIEGVDGDLNPHIRAVEGTIDSVKGLPMDLVTQLLKEVEC